MSQNEETQIPDQLPVTEFNKYELAQNKQHLPQWRQKSLFSINSICCFVYAIPLPYQLYALRLNHTVSQIYADSNSTCFLQTLGFQQCF